MAGLLPHAAERAGLQLSAVSAQSPPATRRRPAAELQQQTAQSEKPAGGADPGGSLLTQMILRLPKLRSAVNTEASFSRIQTCHFL